MSTAALALVSTFALVMVVELPDKTMVATLVLTTRFRAKPVFAGACAAFAVQTFIAVAFGSLLALLPERIMSGIVAVLFAAGAAMLLRQGFARGQQSGEDAARGGPTSATFARSALTTFGVLFAAEWGDASQLAVAGLTARYGTPVAVGVGAFLGLVGVAALAVFIGNKLRDRIRPHLLQRCAGFAFAGFAAFATWQALL